MELSSDEEDFGASLWNSQYSSNFNTLYYFGAWPISTNNKVTKLYRSFQFFALGVVIGLGYLFILDFWLSIGDVKKMSWNFCGSTMFTGSVAKTLLMYGKSDEINTLRRKLHADMEARTDEEDNAIQKACVSQLQKIRRYVYAFIALFICVWQVSRYSSKYTEVKLLPIPLALPFDVDLNVSTNFDIVFVIFSTLGVIGFYFITHQELTIFSLLLQLKREYGILLKNISKMKTGAEGSGYSEEKNPWLQQALRKALVKEFSKHQQIIMRYSETVENCYNKAMIGQVTVVSLLSVAIGFQCIMLTIDYLDELSYQTGYLCIVLTDMYLLCYMESGLDSQCRDVGHALYDTDWYMLDLETQKDLSLMILTSQRPPHLTCLKAFAIDLRAFMMVIKNIYSWLALFRQVAIKIP